MLESWSSRRDFILATTGAAVGLGNIWKFPYMVGENGGSAFIFVYLACILFIGVPLMVAEMLIGRATEQNPVSALSTVQKQSHTRLPLQFVGYLGIMGLLIVLSFYSVLSGWSFAFFLRSITGEFSGQSADGIGNILNQFMASPGEMLLYHSLFLVLTLSIVMRGIQAGLERASRLLMPILFLILLTLVVFALSQGAAKEALVYLFKFNISALNTHVILSAMGHSFFTLALGAGAILMYGAYAPKDIRLPSTVVIIALLDTLVAILAGLAIFPIVMQYNLPPQEGPTLMFISLPTAFAQMPGGNLLAAGFFLFLSIAALTSSINIAEPPIAVLSQKYGWTRKNASLFVGMIVWMLGIGTLLSFNWLADYKLLGMTFFEWMTQIPDKFVLPMGGITFSVIVGWLLDKKTVIELLPMSEGYGFTIWYALVRYVTPAIIALILISSYMNF